VIAAWALAGAAAISATTQPPLYWPALNWMIPHLPSIGSTLTHAEHWIRHHTIGFPRLP
jgi:hypothetical protein